MTPPDDLSAVWQTAADPPPVLAAGDLAELRTEAERFDRQIRWRDRREYAAAVLVAAVFASGFPEADLVGRVGIVLAVLGAAFVCAWMWRAQRRRPPVAPGAPAAQALGVALERVQIQVDLLRSVAWWYLAPLMVGPLVLVGSGLAHAFAGELPPVGTPREALMTAALVGAVVAILAAVGGFLWLVYWLNQRAVARDLVPLRDRLERSLRALTEDPTLTDND